MPLQDHQTELARHAETLVYLAADVLAENQPIDALVPSLRAALHAVPIHDRGTVGLNIDVIKHLVRHILIVLPADRTALNDDGSPVWVDGASLTESEAQELGAFWYACAAEWSVSNPSKPDLLTHESQ